MTFASYMLGWNVAAILCLLVGLALMIYEMFTPGMGFPALFGLVALVASIVLSATSLSHALITLALILIVLGVCAFFVFRAFAQGKLKRIVLSDAVEGTSSSLTGPEMQSLVGASGVTNSALRPSGVAEFDGRRLDVMTAGEFLPKDTPVRVERVEGLRIIVKEISA